MSEQQVPHEYGPSRVGHGEAQCIWCYGTNRENAVITPNHCEIRAARDPEYLTRAMALVEAGGINTILLTTLKRAAHELERYVDLQKILDYQEYAAVTQRELDAINAVIAEADRAQ